MAEVVVDPRGRLVRLAIVPPEREREGAAPSETDWDFLFRQAGLDVNRFTRVEPRWTPRNFASTRAAWEGPHPERPGLTMRVEAASYRGRPVSFLWIGPWTRPFRDPESTPETLAGLLIWQGLLLLFLLGGAAVARHNVRAGRGDRRGAARLVVAVFALQVAMWALGAHHVGSSDEVWVFVNGFCNAVAMGVAFWVLYLALEPFARRRWPEMLISWTRALSGGWRDPLVGRDVLIGAVLGTAAGLILGPLRVLLPPRMGLAGPPPHPFGESAPVNPGLAVAWLVSDGILAAFWVLGIVFLLILTRRILHREWIAGVVVALIFAANYLGSPGAGVTIALAVVSTGALVAITIRFGVLAAIAAEVCRRIFGYRIYTHDPSSWYFYASVIAVVGVLGLAYWATRTALAGQPLFGEFGLEEKAPAGE
jgi:serine/threonine-protein kinase